MCGPGFRVLAKKLDDLRDREAPHLAGRQRMIQSRDDADRRTGRLAASEGVAQHLEPRIALAVQQQRPGPPRETFEALARERRAGLRQAGDPLPRSLGPLREPLWLPRGL